MALDPTELRSRAQRIRLLILDVDGVLTDGAIIIDDTGKESKNFNVLDGFGVAIWRRHGGQTAILSGRRAAAVDHRARELKIEPVVQGSADKLAAFRQMVADLRILPEESCFIGDDLPDLPVFPACGLSACPADADPRIRAAAHWIGTRAGGKGVVRELIEMLLEAQGRWSETIAHYSRIEAAP